MVPNAMRFDRADVVRDSHNSSNGGKIMANKSFFVICAMVFIIWVVLKAHLGILFHFSDTAILGFILGVVVTLFVIKK